MTTNADDSFAPTCVVVRHVAFEDLGVWAGVLASHHYTVTYVDAGVDSLTALADADLGIVLGGPIGVGDMAHYPYLTDEVAALGERIGAGLPTVGVCLGAQLMAVALGGSVAHGEPEIGWGLVGLTGAGRKGILAPLADARVLHWHGDKITPPLDATVLAWTQYTTCQAFEIGNALALQFHVEVDPLRIEQWLIGHSVELAAHGIDPATIRASASAVGEQSAAAGRRVLENYLDGVKQRPSVA